MEKLRQDATVLSAIAHTWLAVATLLAIVGQVAHILGRKDASYTLAGFALCFLLAFWFFLVMSSDFDADADELEEVVRRVSKPIRPVAHRRRKA